MNSNYYNFGWEYTGYKDYKEEVSIKSVDDEENEFVDSNVGSKPSPVGSNNVDVKEEPNTENLKKKVATYLRKKKLEALVAKKKCAVVSEDKKSKIGNDVATVKPKSSPVSVKLCKLCEKAPCVVDDFYDDLMSLGADMEDHCSHKQIRHVLYRFAAKKLWGRLGAGNRRELPRCVLSEIRDAYPATKGTEYVGFQGVADGGNEGH
jgi:hypothetical protein